MTSLSPPSFLKSPIPSTASAMRLAQATPVALIAITAGAMMTVVVTWCLHQFGLTPILGGGVAVFMLGLLAITLTLRGLIDYAALVFTLVFFEAHDDRAQKAAIKARFHRRLRAEMDARVQAKTQPQDT